VTKHIRIGGIEQAQEPEPGRPSDARRHRGTSPRLCHARRPIARVDLEDIGKFLQEFTTVRAAGSGCGQQPLPEEPGAAGVGADAQ
jgi:hypothetical protein